MNAPLPPSLTLRARSSSRLRPCPRRHVLRPHTLHGSQPARALYRTRRLPSANNSGMGPRARAYESRTNRCRAPRKTLRAAHGRAIGRRERRLSQSPATAFARTSRDLIRRIAPVSPGRPARFRIAKASSRLGETTASASTTTTASAKPLLTLQANACASA